MPSFSWSRTTSAASPVANVQPGRAPNRAAYFASAGGSSCDGSMVIEIRKMSRPAWEPSASYSLTRFALASEHCAVQVVNMKLMLTIFPLTRSS
jgi:hypothetical protein